MIPIVMQPEPLTFEEKVRKKGQRFINQNPNPREWKNRSYWREILPDLWCAYNSVCAYSCQWIPLEQGSASVDHFVPKSVDPFRAYEWDNYRLAASKMNAKKGDATDVVDPFELSPMSFHLLFPSMLIKPNPALSEERQRELWATIERLDLNDDEPLIRSRLQWVLDYSDGEISFPYLKRKAPFIAFEIERQGLQEILPKMFQKRTISSQESHRS